MYQPDKFALFVVMFLYIISMKSSEYIQSNGSMGMEKFDALTCPHYLSVL